MLAWYGERVRRKSELKAVTECFFGFAEKSAMLSGCYVLLLSSLLLLSALKLKLMLMRMQISSISGSYWLGERICKVEWDDVKCRSVREESNTAKKRLRWDDWRERDETMEGRTFVRSVIFLAR